MNIPFLCIGLAFLLLHLTKIPVALAMSRRGYDNRYPRDQQARLEGWGRRATAAHQNAFESFAPFVAAVLIAHISGADPAWSARLSLLFIAARVSYTFLYIANRPGWRSAVWMVGTFCTAGLLGLGLAR